MTDGEEAGPLGWRIIFGRLSYGLSPEATTAWSWVHITMAVMLGILIGIAL